MTLEPTTHDTSHGEGGPLVLFAVEPRSYAQAIGQTVVLLRPHLEVVVVELKDLTAEMGRRLPALVFCGEERPDGCSQAVRWARFSPYEEPEVVRVDGVAERYPGLGLGDIVGIVDRLAVASRRG